MVTLTSPLYLLLLLLLPLPVLLWRRKKFAEGAGIRLILLLRLGTIVLASLTLAGPRLQLETDRVNLFFCLDVSDSISSEANLKGLEYIGKTVGELTAGDQAGLIVFGGKPSLEKELQPALKAGQIRSLVGGSETDIYSALQMAIGRFPSAGTNRIVLLSDGNESRNNALDMAYLSSRLGVEIYPFPLHSQNLKNEIIFEQLITPQYIQLNQNFTIQLLISSIKQTECDVELYRNDLLLQESRLNLQPGKNSFTMTDRLNQSGLYSYRAVISSNEDANLRNNKSLSFVKGTEIPSVLYIVDQNSSDAPFARVLSEHGIGIVKVSPGLSPSNLNELLTYNAVILDNVSKDDLPMRMIANLESYVRDLGGGLIMLGGDKSFGVGGYSGSAIEKALPVFLEPQTTTDFPGLCLFLLIDKSSSMAEKMGDQPKLEAAKIAAFSSIEILNPLDQVGILAFDSGYRWIVPTISAKERDKIKSKLSGLSGNGGTDLGPALKEAIDRIKKIDAIKKHIIVLSDGLADDQKLDDLLLTKGQTNITLSSVAVGKNANLALLKEIAEKGGGRSYLAETSSHIPRIFVDETKIVARSGVKEKRLTPVLVNRHQLASSPGVEEFPVIDGINVTYSKPGSDTVLATSEGPLLAAWQYGLGRSIAFMSDLRGRWSYGWLQWDEFGGFLTRMITWVQKKPAALNYTLTVERDEAASILKLDAMDRDGKFINNLNLHMTLLSPEKNRTNYRLDQVSPGIYTTRFPSAEIGEYYFSIHEQNRSSVSDIQSFGFGIPYSEEYKTNRLNRELLQQIADISNGQILTPDYPSKNLLKPDSKKRDDYKNLWPHFLLATLLLLILELIVRMIRGRP
ncbi:VWA domain-containing protein [bacterium]|nr:VWA domain-containing protein [bacterium]